MKPTKYELILENGVAYLRGYAKEAARGFFNVEAIHNVTGWMLWVGGAFLLYCSVWFLGSLEDAVIHSIGKMSQVARMTIAVLIFVGVYCRREMLEMR